MNTQSPRPIQSPLLSQLKGIKHGFFTRLGGISTGDYDSLNTGLHGNDDIKTVLQNRYLALQAIHKQLHLKSLFMVRQQHTAKVHVVQDSCTDNISIAHASAAKTYLTDTPIADAMVTNRVGVALGILTADCLPVIFVDPTHSVIGIAHCGWRGAFDNITTQTVIAMERLGATHKSIYACLGPCISQNNYQVGQEFYEKFLDQNTNNKQFFNHNQPNDHHKSTNNIDGQIQGQGANSMSRNLYYFDLQGYVMEQLRPLGLKVIETIDICTYGNADLLFSHRRESQRGQQTGRQISIVSLSHPFFVET